MNYHNADIAKVAQILQSRLAELNDKAEILKAPELRDLLGQIKDLPAEQRASFGQEVNQLKQELAAMVADAGGSRKDTRPPIDITAPMDVNAPRPGLLPTENGSVHPLMQEIAVVADIFYRMGFNVESSREMDDAYHMFDSLNFPEGHPARDEYDTFVTTDGLIAPAHTSTMQNRVMKKYAQNLEQGNPIAVVVPDRVFRNEDVDARHEHTFYQCEGVYVGKNITVGNLVATLRTFFSDYFGKDIKIKTQPFYFPFTEPSLEFAAECVFCGQKGCNICSYSGWIELGGCGAIHPNVLKMAGIDPEKYTGFAWGNGVDRLVMLKYGIEDVRHFQSAKLDFLRQF